MPNILVKSELRTVFWRATSTGVLDRPDLDLSKLPTPATESGLGGGERQKSKKLGGGSYRCDPPATACSKCIMLAAVSI